jgi:hypothetical protein
VFSAVGVDLEIIRDPNGVTASFPKYARANGFPDVRIHDIRARNRIA